MSRSDRSRGPLLVIAGAGSGKTNTLAHRVAHLVRTGADPQRMLLLTFSRRAAAEMERRAARMLQRVLAAAARRRRHHAAVGGHLPQHRRAAAARVRRAHRPGRIVHHPRPRRCRRPDGAGAPRDRVCRATKKRFPPKGTCLAIYSRVVNSGEPLAEVLQTPSRGARSGKPSSRRCSARTSASQAGAERARLRRPAAVLVGDDGRARARRARSARASTTCWSTNTRTPIGCRRRSCWR